MLEPYISFDEIYVRNWGKLIRYAISQVQRKYIAEELVQDTFHDAYAKFNQLIKHDNIDGWLMQTLKYKIRNYRRARQREEKYVEEWHDIIDMKHTSDEFTNNLIARNEVALIYKFVYSNFNKDDLFLFRRMIIEGANHKEVSEELGITVWTSQKRLERIRKRIKEKFPDF